MWRSHQFRAATSAWSFFKQAATADHLVWSSSPTTAFGGHWPASNREEKTFIYINNRLEGNALETISAILDAAAS